MKNAKCASRATTPGPIGAGSAGTVLAREVRDVLPTPHDDRLCVVYRGKPDPDGWTATLTAAGFPTPRFEETTLDANIDEPDSAAA